MNRAWSRFRARLIGWAPGLREDVPEGNEGVEGGKHLDGLTRQHQALDLQREKEKGTGATGRIRES